MDGFDPMKVLYFTRDDSVHDRRFLETMTSSGMKVFLLRLNGNSGSLQSLPQGVRELHWQAVSFSTGDGTMLPQIEELKKIIREVQPDLIHAGPLTDCALIAAKTGFQPLVSMSWGSDILAGGQWSFRKKKNLKKTLRQTSVMIGDCQAVKQKAEALGFPKERVVTFPWGVDLKHFSPGSGAALRKKWGYEKNFVILSLRSWEPIYGVDILVKAFILAARNNPTLRLILGGTGSQEEKIRRMVRESGIEDQIRFLGYISQLELPKIYQSSDVYISASHSDGSSVSLMEALACGIPVLVSDISGNREWITEGQNGRLFRDGNIHQLSVLMMTAPKEKEDLKKMSLNNRQLAIKKADWKRNSKGLIQAYNMALKLKGPA